MKRSELLIRVIILPLDYLGILISFILAYVLRGSLEDTFLIPFADYAPLAMGFSLLWIVCLWLSGIYRIDIQRKEWDELLGIIIGSLAAITLTSSFIFFLGEVEFSRIVLITSAILAVVLLIVIRLFREIGVRELYKRGYGIRRLLITGSGNTTQIVLEGIEAERDPGIKVVAVVPIEDFMSAFNEYLPDEVIQTDTTLSNDKVASIINICEEHGKVFRFVPNLFEVPAANVATYNLAGVPMITLSVTAIDGWYAVFKRVIDLFGALLALVLISPLLAVVAVAIKLDSNGTVLYRHRRVGKNGVEFDLLKFRSMRMLEVDGVLVHADANTQVEQLKDKQKNYKLLHDPRVTRVGAIIRKTSIDELPQLINVLRGEISLVGPRAYLKKELDSQLEKFPEAKGLVRRLTTVRPGITGIWQVSGRSNIEFSERVAMDAYYATHASFALDLKLLLQTIPVVIKGTGAM